jgi:hypothetical protein
MDAQDVVPTLVGPGGEIGEDTVPEGKVAAGDPQQRRQRR